jgi:hypothetical protein
MVGIGDAAKVFCRNRNPEASTMWGRLQMQVAAHAGNRSHGSQLEHGYADKTA